MLHSKLAYYAGFPLLVLALCIFSYYLGWSRGKQAAQRGPAAEPAGEALADHEKAEDLTFFRTLKEGVPLSAPADRARPEDLPAAAETAPARPPELPAAGGDEAGAAVPLPASGIYVQVSAFRDIGKAHELMDRLRNAGFPAVTKLLPGRGLHRVCVGPYDSKEQAQNVSSTLTSKGFPKGFVTRL